IANRTHPDACALRRLHLATRYSLFRYSLSSHRPFLTGDLRLSGPIRLGVAPIAWSNSDLPQLGGETTLETCLRESRKAGFSGTETGVKFPMDAKVLRPKLEANRLKLVSGWFSGELLKRSVAA